jgi:hypothetical protein
MMRSLAGGLVAVALAMAVPCGHAAVSAASRVSLRLVPGGELDPAFTDADVYKGTPTPPNVPEEPGCKLAANYVQLVNAGQYVAVARLFADDATFLEPMRPTLQGRAQIDAFYTGRIGRMQPQVVAVRYFGMGRECLVELALQTQIDGRERYVLVSIDHFTLDESGKVQSMIAFARPSRGAGGKES